MMVFYLIVINHKSIDNYIAYLSSRNILLFQNTSLDLKSVNEQSFLLNAKNAKQNFQQEWSKSIRLIEVSI